MASFQNKRRRIELKRIPSYVQESREVALETLQGKERMGIMKVWIEKSFRQRYPRYLPYISGYWRKKGDPSIRGPTVAQEKSGMEA